MDAIAITADLSPLPTKPNRMAGLEALRGIAAFSVMLLHIPAIFHGPPPVFGKGYLGVDLFFMLSGFVMTRGFEAKMAAGISLPGFIRDRYIRMWPIMAVGGLIGLPLLWLRTPDHIQFGLIALANFLLLPVSFQRETFPLNVPAWTIFFILLGNLVHGLGLYRLSQRALVIAIAGCAVLLAIVASHAGSLDVGARPENLIYGIPRLLLSYLIGIGLSRAWREKPIIFVPPIIGLAGMPVLVAAAWRLGISSWVFDLAFVTLACPLLIAGCMNLTSGARLAGFVGAWSFPLYAIHFPLLIWFRLWGYNWSIAALAALALSAAVTVVDLRWQKSHR